MRPTTATLVADEIANQALAMQHRGIVLIDGADAARPDELGAAVADRVRLGGRQALPVHAGDFLRPASLRWEFGHEDVDSFYSCWLDVDGLFREVFDRWQRPDPTHILTTLHDPVTDRATRADYTPVTANAMLLVDGELLLGKGFPADLTVHLALSAAALRRSTTPRWMLPAFERYRTEVDPERIADVLVRVDHPDRPAIRP